MRGSGRGKESDRRAGRRLEREQREGDAERARDRERQRDWDRHQQQRRQHQREDTLAATGYERGGATTLERERERSSRQQAHRDHAIDSFEDFLSEMNRDAPNPFLPVTAATAASQHSNEPQPRRRRSVRFNLENPFASSADVGHVDRAEHLDAVTAVQSAAAQSGEADGTFDSFEMRTWQPSTSIVQPARVVVRFFVYDRPGRLAHYSSSSVSTLPSVIYTCSSVLNVSVDPLGAVVSTSAVPLADSEGDGMRRGWMNSEWKSVSAAVMIDDTIDAQHNGLEHTAVDYLYATLRHRAHGLKQQGEGDVELSSGHGHVRGGGQLYMEDLTGEEGLLDNMDGMNTAIVDEAVVPSMPATMKRRRVDE